MSDAIENLTAAQRRAMAGRPRGGFPYLAEVLRQAGVVSYEVDFIARKNKRGHSYIHAFSLPGLPRGRSVKLRPRRSAVCRTHGGEPYGRPRLMLVRIGSKSSTSIFPFTRRMKPGRG
jgi:hypothetical protein